MDSVERELQNFFPKSSLEDWRRIAMQETQGKDPFNLLSWLGKDDLLFLPYYNAQTDGDLLALQPFQLPAAKNAPTASWRNLPLVKVADEKTSNELALQHLLHGSDGVIFDARNLQPDLNALTDTIEWSSCYIAFYTTDNRPLHDELSAVTKNSFVPSLLKGALFWESIPKNNNFDFYFEQCENFRALGLRITETTPAAEISDALIQGLKMFENFARSADAREVLRSICFSLPAGGNSLECIAKFKALRLLWFQIAHAYGHADYKMTDLHLHARSELVPDRSLGPNENMLKGTFAAMAAILGSCNSLTIESENNPPFVSRWARNVSIILKEESFFDHVTDPFAGAWALDSITVAIAKKSWAMFQEKWRTYAKA